MSALSVPCSSVEAARAQAAATPSWRTIRSAVFWGAIFVILISPAALSALILARG